MSKLNLIKVVAQIAGVVHELGEYAPPVIEAITKLRQKGPTRPDNGQEESFEETRAKLRAAIEVAQAIQTDAESELDALDRKAAGQ